MYLNELSISDLLYVYVFLCERVCACVCEPSSIAPHRLNPVHIATCISSYNVPWYANFVEWRTNK